MHFVSDVFLCVVWCRSRPPERMNGTAGWSSVTNRCSSCLCTYLRRTGEVPTAEHTLSSPRLVTSHAVCTSVLLRSLEILELSEHKDLLKFHYHTLRLYSAICALGNNRVAHALCSHVDEAQLLHAIENKYMPGNRHRI